MKNNSMEWIQTWRGKSTVYLMALMLMYWIVQYIKHPDFSLLAGAFIASLPIALIAFFVFREKRWAIIFSMIVLSLVLAARLAFHLNMYFQSSEFGKIGFVLEFIVYYIGMDFLFRANKEVKERKRANH